MRLVSDEEMGKQRKRCMRSLEFVCRACFLSPPLFAMAWLFSKRHIQTASHRPFLFVEHLNTSLSAARRSARRRPAGRRATWTPGPPGPPIVFFSCFWVCMVWAMSVSDRPNPRTHPQPATYTQPPPTLGPSPVRRRRARASRATTAHSRSSKGLIPPMTNTTSVGRSEGRRLFGGGVLMVYCVSMYVHAVITHIRRPLPHKTKPTKHHTQNPLTPGLRHRPHPRPRRRQSRPTPRRAARCPRPASQSPPG